MSGRLIPEDLTRVGNRRASSSSADTNGGSDGGRLGGVGSNIAQEGEELLDVVVTDEEATITVNVGGVSRSIRGLTTVECLTVLVEEARDTDEVALTQVGGASQTIVASDSSGGELTTSDSGDISSQVNVQVMDKEIRVSVDLLLHDSAIHTVSRVHEDTLVIDITISGNFATSLPLTVGIDTVSDERVRTARVVALVVTSDVISHTTMSQSSINTGEVSTVDALLGASSSGIGSALTTVGSNVIAVSKAIIAEEYAVTTSL